jgi:hypothetical protein
MVNIQDHDENKGHKRRKEVRDRPERKDIIPVEEAHIEKIHRRAHKEFSHQKGVKLCVDEGPPGYDGKKLLDLEYGHAAENHKKQNAPDIPSGIKQLTETQEHGQPAAEEDDCVEKIRHYNL